MTLCFVQHIFRIVHWDILGNTNNCIELEKKSSKGESVFPTEWLRDRIWKTGAEKNEARLHLWYLEVGNMRVGTFSELHHVVIVLVTTGHAVNQMTLFTMMMRWWQWYCPGNFGKEQKAQKCTILDRSNLSKFSWGPTLFRWLRRTRRFSYGCKTSPSDLFVFHFPSQPGLFFHCWHDCKEVTCKCVTILQNHHLNESRHGLTVLEDTPPTDARSSSSP